MAYVVNLPYINKIEINCCCALDLFHCVKTATPQLDFHFGEEEKEVMGPNLVSVVAAT